MDNGWNEPESQSSEAWRGPSTRISKHVALIASRRAAGRPVSGSITVSRAPSLRQTRTRELVTLEQALCKPFKVAKQDLNWKSVVRCGPTATLVASGWTRLLGTMTSHCLSGPGSRSAARRRRQPDRSSPARRRGGDGRHGPHALRGHAATVSTEVRIRRVRPAASW